MPDIVPRLILGVFAPWFAHSVGLMYQNVSPMVHGLIYLVVSNTNLAKKHKFLGFVLEFLVIVQMTGQVAFANSIV